MATADKRPYKSGVILNQSFLDDCHDNLSNQLELIVDIETPTGMLHLSDRNKYVGSTFYEARLNFPIISRTIGEFLSPTLEFSQLQLEVNNSDGKYNNLLPSGADYSGWIGKTVSVKLGLRDVESTYTQIFSGSVTDQGGFQRSFKSFTLVARNDFEKLNVSFPKSVFSAISYPDIETDLENAIVPIIYGDWTVNVEPDAASIPAFVVNGEDPDVDGTASYAGDIWLVISETDNSYFDSSSVYVQKSQGYYKIDPSDIIDVVANKSFQIKQSGGGGVTQIEGKPYEYSKGDKFFVRVKGKDLGAYSDNLVSQAKDILKTYCGISDASFDSSWDTFKDKASPSESAIKNIKSRVWIQEPEQALSYVLSMLEQVRLEAFIDRNLKIKLSSLHFDEFSSNPSFKINNWDVEEGSFSPSIDDRNNFNRVKGAYNYLPNRNENFQETAIYRNSAAIIQVKKEISKKVVFPNLYVLSDVEAQVIELLKVTSSYLEYVDLTLTWRSLLLDIGNFVRLNVNIQGSVFENVPAMVRNIGYDPAGVKLPVKLLSYQMLPFPGWTPGYPGTTGGSTAIIEKE